MRKLRAHRSIPLFALLALAVSFTMCSGELYAERTLEPGIAQVTSYDKEGNVIAEFDMPFTTSPDPQGGAAENVEAPASPTTLYSNSFYSSPLAVNANQEMIDFGTFPGGIVTSFRIGLHPLVSGVVDVDVRFYKNVSSIRCPTANDLVAHWEIAFLWTAFDIRFQNFSIPEAQRFSLPEGPFGYSYTIGGNPQLPARSDLLLASGGAGNVNRMWLAPCTSVIVPGDYAGLYMRISGLDLASELSVDPNDPVLQCPAGQSGGCNGQEMILRSTGDAPLHVISLDGPDWLNITPPEPNVVLEIGEQMSVCLEPICSECTGESLTGSIRIKTNDPNDPNGVHTSSVTVICGGCDVQADLDGDCDVDMPDFGILSGYYQAGDCFSPAWCDGADYNRSGTVDFGDALFLFASWLEGTVAPSSEHPPSP